MPYETAFALTLAGLSAFLIARRAQSNAKRKGLPLPPGPKGYPLVGNAFDIPTKFEWEAYNKWAQEHDSDIVYANALGMSIVVLHSRQAAAQILDAKSAVTSGRPLSPMIADLMGWDYILPLCDYGESFKEKRKLFQQHFHPNNMGLHRAGVRQSLPVMLASLLDNPEDFRDINKNYMAGTIMKLTYGIHQPDRIDYYSKLLDDAISSVVRAAIPGAYLVDIFPILKYVPEWVPGAGFKREAREGRELGRRLGAEPLEEALNEMGAGQGEQCFVSDAYSQAESRGGIDEKHLRTISDVGASVSSAGTETTLSSIDYFYYTMTEYPEVQRKAQKELDNYLKGERLPDFDDQPHLPYITALVRELLRWQPATPLGVAHLSSEDIIYNGYLVPKGSIIMGNEWAMLRDEREYPEPDVFRPERYLTPDGKLDPKAPNPESIAFGFGRRVCPGSHLALSTLFVTISSVLTVFTITKVEEFDSARQVRLGITRSPMKFRCGIMPRVRNASELIRDLHTL